MVFSAAHGFQLLLLGYLTFVFNNICTRASLGVGERLYIHHMRRNKKKQSILALLFLLEDQGDD